MKHDKRRETLGHANPRAKAGKPAKHLSAKQKGAAEKSAKIDGRPRPSLVDNMNALKTSRGTGKASAAKTQASKKATAKTATTTKVATKKAATKKSVTKVSAKTTRKPEKPAAKTAPKKTIAKAPLKTAGQKTAAKKTPLRKTTKSPSRKHPQVSEATKDPHGGLTAQGRKMFAKTQGAHLRPGVTKADSEMTPDEMRRKGSWAVRFYGRKVLPPLLDHDGQPTRFALSAHAWGEPVPNTEEAARKIADKGRKLLEKYKGLKT